MDRRSIGVCGLLQRSYDVRVYPERLFWRRMIRLIWGHTDSFLFALSLSVRSEPKDGFHPLDELHDCGIHARQVRLPGLAIYVAHRANVIVSRSLGHCSCCHASVGGIEIRPSKLSLGGCWGDKADRDHQTACLSPIIFALPRQPTMRPLSTATIAPGIRRRNVT